MAPAARMAELAAALVAQGATVLVAVALAAIPAQETPEPGGVAAEAEVAAAKVILFVVAGMSTLLTRPPLVVAAA